MLSRLTAMPGREVGSVSYTHLDVYKRQVLYILIMALTTMLANLSMWIYLPRYVCRISFKSLQIKDHFKQTLMYFIPTIATSIYTVLDKRCV